ncbi:MAG: hypothetical protein ACRCUI_04965, partial [Polymorphobacter sp.]
MLLRTPPRLRCWRPLLARRPLLAGLALLLAPGALAAAPVAGPQDADTQAWWQLTTALSTDALRGRDTGSAEHRRAVEAVARDFAAAGLKPAGDAGSFFQNVPLREVAVEKAGSAVAVVRANGKMTPLRWLQEIAIRPTAQIPVSIDAGIVFRGYCSAAEIGNGVEGKIILCFGARRSGLTNAAQRLEAVAAAGAIGMISIDDVGFTKEPPRWPD